MLQQLKEKLSDKELQQKIVKVAVVTGVIIIGAVVMHTAKEKLNEALYGGQLELNLNWNKKPE